MPLVYLLWVLVDCQQAWEMEVWKDGSDCRLSQAANILLTREIWTALGLRSLCRFLRLQPNAKNSEWVLAWHRSSWTRSFPGLDRPFVLIDRGCCPLVIHFAKIISYTVLVRPFSRVSSILTAGCLRWYCFLPFIFSTTSLFFLN